MMKVLEGLVVLAITIIHGPGSARGEDPLQQPSIPCIPDSYFIPENATNFHGTKLTTSRPGFTYIFLPPWPWQQCMPRVNGTIMIQYCYETNARHFGREVDVFLFFRGSLSNGNDQFTFKQRYTVRSTPGNDTCFMPEGSMVYYCCDVNNIGRRMPSPSTNAFGIAVNHNGVLPLVTASMYNVPQFQLGPSHNQGILTGLNQVYADAGIPLLRLLIQPGMQELIKINGLTC